jgi:hypothetical protein
VIVYVREAHPDMLREGNGTGVVGNPKDLHERVILATQCVSQYKFTIPMVIDGMDGKVNRDYDAAPVRVTVVDIDGKVAFYAGQGPADFRIPPVEKTIKKLIANKGHMPPAPAPQWGGPVNGLRCGLSFDPQKLTLGEQVNIVLTFQNTSDKPIAMRYDPVESLRHIVISNDDGRTLKMEMSAAGRQARMDRGSPQRGRGIPLQGIRPGQSFQSEIEARILAASDAATSVTGQFQAIYSLEVNQDTLTGMESSPQRPLWTGRIASGACTLQISPPPPPNHKP